MHFLFWLLLVACSQQLRAQSLQSLDSLYRRSWKSVYTSQESEEIKDLFLVDTLRHTDFKAEVLLESASAMQKDFGLRFISSYIRNYGDGLNDENENFARERLMVGLEWNLLNQGWRDKHLTSQILQNEYELEILESQSNAQEEAYGYLYNRTIYAFNQKKIELIKSRIAILGEIDQRFESYYNQLLLPFAELLELRKKKARYEQLLQDYSEYNRAYEIKATPEDFTKASFSIFDLSIGSLGNAVSKSDYFKTKLELQNENVQLKAKKDQDLSLKAFARRNYTVNGLSGLNQNFNTVGVTFSVPIKALYSDRSKKTNLLIQENQHNVETESYHMQKEVMNHTYEYQYKLQQYQQLVYDKILLKEEIRKDQVYIQNLDQKSSYINALKNLQYLSEIELELIDLSSQLYLKLLKIQTLLPSLNIKDFLVKKDFGLRSQKRWVVQDIDPKSATYSKQFIEMYLAKNKLTLLGLKNEITLSVDPKDFQTRQMMEQFLTTRKERDIVITSLQDLIELDQRSIAQNH